MTTAEKRLDELEIRIAHQDKAIADLSEVITAQWKQIENLERQLRRLADEMRDLEGEAPPITKPPHY